MPRIQPRPQPMPVPVEAPVPGYQNRPRTFRFTDWASI